MEEQLPIDKDKESLNTMRARVIALEKLATIGELVGGIAHELKNPLGVISNFAQLSVSLLADLVQEMKSTTSPPSDVEEVVETIKSNLEQIMTQSKRASSIVQRVLAQAKGEPDRFTLTDINRLLDESVLLAYHGMRANDPTFNVRFDKHYDTTLESFYTISEDIGRVFLNLLNNAFYAISKKHAQLGDSYEPVLIVTSKQIDNTCQITIRDNGEGIPQHNREKIFTPFFTTKAAGQGTGLGLMLSKNIVHKGHQGTLTFDSEEGKFTEFTMTIPIRSTLDVS